MIYIYYIEEPLQVAVISAVSVSVGVLFIGICILIMCIVIWYKNCISIIAILLVQFGIFS